MAQLIATNQLTLTNVNDGAPGPKGDTGSILGENKWIGRKYSYPGSTRIYPSFDHINGLNPIATEIFDDSTKFSFWDDYYIAHFQSNLYVNIDKQITTTVTHDDDLTIYCNDEVVVSKNTTIVTPYDITFNLKAGWNKIDILLHEIAGGDQVIFGTSLSSLVDHLSYIKGADGLPTYIHWAYSDNADGTGLTTSDNGQRYIGQYSDNIKTDSTDKTKYHWADRFAKIEVGGRNYILKSQAELSSASRWVNKEFNLSSDLLSNSSKIKTVTISCDVEGRNVTGFNNLKRFGLSWPVEINGIVNFWEVWQAEDTTKKRISQTFTVTEGKTITKSYSPSLWIQAVGDIRVSNPKIEFGTVFTDWSRADEDIQADIDAKADQALTQQQINALNEKNQILEAEMKAKASMEAFSELEKTYQSFVKANADGQAKAEADLVEAGRRIEMLTTQFGGLAELKIFIDTYMSSSNEGLIIGKNDASSTIKVSSDRISMFSAGKEVMYISQGVININNGIFTISVQIGKFRTEQYHLNVDMNVIRYVG